MQYTKPILIELGDRTCMINAMFYIAEIINNYMVYTNDIYMLYIDDVFEMYDLYYLAEEQMDVVLRWDRVRMFQRIAGINLLPPLDLEKLENEPVAGNQIALIGFI